MLQKTNVVGHRAVQQKTNVGHSAVQQKTMLRNNRKQMLLDTVRCNRKQMLLDTVWNNRKQMLLDTVWNNRKQMLLDTVRCNRKNMPKEFGKYQLKAMKLKKSDVVFRSCEEGLIAIVWKDKNYVRKFSTMHTSGMKDTGKEERNGNPRLKPQCGLTYNGGMGGVDASDQMATT